MWVLKKLREYLILKEKEREKLFGGCSKEEKEVEEEEDLYFFDPQISSQKEVLSEKKMKIFIEKKTKETNLPSSSLSFLSFSSPSSILNLLFLLF